MLTPTQSHEISLETLSILDRYQDYMDNIKQVSVMGCGTGMDAHWWATAKNQQTGETRNIKVNAVDRKLDPSQLYRHENINYINKDYTLTDILPDSQNLIYSHNSFQYSLSPFHTLLHWRSLLKNDGMMIVSVPYNYYIHNNKDIINVGQTYYNSSYFNWSMGNLIMMLVATGFDCRQAHFKLDRVSGWLHAAVYKLPILSDHILDWYDMCDQKLLPLSIENAIMKNGTFKDADIVVEWLDRSQYILSV